MTVKMSCMTLARRHFADVVLALGPRTKFTQGKQSHRNSVPGSAWRAAWYMAQASAPGISTIQPGGMPLASATTSPSSPMTEKDHPRRIRLPGRCAYTLDPSEYTVPLKVSPEGRRIQVKDSWAGLLVDGGGGTIPRSSCISGARER